MRERGRRGCGIRDRRGRSATVAAAATAALLALTACSAPAGGPAATESPASAPSPAAGAGETPAPAVSAPVDARPFTAGAASVVATDLEAPWSIAFLGETPLLSERDSARILELAADGSTRVVAEIAGVEPNGEAGLLGIAVRDRALYAYSTGANGNRIERYGITGEPGSLALSSPTTLLDGIPSASTHDGGRLAFGPDGMLYATTGDAGNRPSAQDPSSLAGKILRLSPDGSIPADNPFPGSPVYTLGHRNPQGLAWGPDGTMYASEFGQDAWDELNVVRAGANYGWPVVEGVGGDPAYVDPVQVWRPAEASPSGVAIVGATLFVANLRGQVLREVRLADAGAATERFAGDYGRLRDAVRAPDGSLWLLTNNTDGRGSPRAGDDRVLRVELSPA